MHAHTMRPPFAMMMGGPGRRHRGPHGGFGPGPFGPPPRARRDRGDIRQAILLLLDEQPRHGYEIMTELTERSEGRWRPSPGSVYPILKRLAKDGLVQADETDGKKTFSLTPAGRTLVEQQRDEWGQPWARASAENEDVTELWAQAQQLGAAVWQVGQSGTEDQIKAAGEALAEARKTIYRMLAQ